MVILLSFNFNKHAFVPIKIYYSVFSDMNRQLSLFDQTNVPSFWFKCHIRGYLRTQHLMQPISYSGVIIGSPIRLEINVTIKVS